MSDLGHLFELAGGALESFGTGLIARLGPLNVWTAALLGGAFVLDRALSRRARASWRIALYAPIALRILLPLAFRLPLPNAPRVMTFFAPALRIGASPAADLPAWHPPTWRALVAVVYVVVMALLVARVVVARVRLGRALAGAQPVDGPHPDVPCPVLAHDDLGPMAVGLIAPRIVLPRRLLVAGEEHARACVLRHEAAHLRRRDAWLSAGMQLLAVVAWPVIPLWIAMARVRQLIELACDEAALAHADAAERRRYGHALLDMAEWRTFAVAPLGAGELHFGSTLHARIEALAAQRHWPLALQAIALTVTPIALFVACGGTAAPPAAPPSDDGTGYGYEFEADSAKVAAVAAPVAPLPAGPNGRIPPETIQSTVRAHFGALRACYEGGLKKNAKLAGTVTVRFVIAVDGSTTEASDEKSTLPDKDVVGCVVGELGKLTFPKGAEVATVVYPIQFAP